MLMRSEEWTEKKLENLITSKLMQVSGKQVEAINQAGEQDSKEETGNTNQKIILKVGRVTIWKQDSVKIIL